MSNNLFSFVVMNLVDVFQKIISWSKYRLTRIVIAIILLFVLYFELESKGTFTLLGHDLITTLSNVSTENILIIGSLLVFNVVLETLKWKFSLNEIYNLSFYEAFKGVVTGASFGIVTPHGIGDYGGRLLYLSKDKLIEAGIINFINSLSQNIIHFVIGSFSVLLVYGLYNSIFGIFYFIGFTIVTIIIIWVYFDLARFEKWMIRWIKNEKWKNRLIFASELNFTTSKKIILLALSLIRYSCYVTLYAYLLVVFGAESSVGTIMLYVTIIFLIQSGLPLPASIGALARIEIAILIFTNLNINANIIVLSSLSIWILNLLLPSLLGILLMTFSDGTKIQSSELIK